MNDDQFLVYVGLMSVLSAIMGVLIVLVMK